MAEWDAEGDDACGREAPGREALCAAQTTTAMARRGALGEERDAEARRHLPLEPVDDRVEQQVERRVERLQRVDLRPSFSMNPALLTIASSVPSWWTTRASPCSAPMNNGSFVAISRVTSARPTTDAHFRRCFVSGTSTSRWNSLTLENTRWSTVFPWNRKIIGSPSKSARAPRSPPRAPTG